MQHKSVMCSNEFRLSFQFLFSRTCHSNNNDDYDNDYDNDDNEIIRFEMMVYDQNNLDQLLLGLICTHIPCHDFMSSLLAFSPILF